MDNFPTKGSATVLNTNADNGDSSFTLISISLLLFMSFALCGLNLSGDGKHSSISSNKVLIPIPVSAEPHITGAISPLEQPFMSPSYISSSLSVPSLKYLSSKAYPTIEQSR